MIVGKIRGGVATLVLITVIGIAGAADDVAGIEAKLAALDKARAAGILSDEEYAAKKAELRAALDRLRPPLDEATRRKLDALDAAREAGILSPAEYERKKAALLGAASRPGAATKLYRDGKGRFELRYPDGFVASPLPAGDGVAVTRGSWAVSLLLVEGPGAPAALVGSIASNFRAQWRDYQATGQGETRIGSTRAPVLDFSGVNPRGEPSAGRIAAAVIGGRGCVFILTVPLGERDRVESTWTCVLSSFAFAAAGEAASDGPAEWKTYRHEIGVSFRHPPDWRIELQNGLPRLVPADTAMENGAPLEFYFAFGESLEGQEMTRPDDPRLIAYLDAQLKSLVPGLARTGDARPIPVPGKTPAVAVDWQGTGATGKVLLARCYILVLKGHALSLVGLGEQGRVAARDATLRRIFATFAFGEPAAGGGGDARLIGSWNRERNFGTGTFSSTTVTCYTFAADGTFVSQAQYAAADQSETRASDVTRRQGRWSAAGGVLILKFSDGDSARVKYHIEDPSQAGSTAATMGKRLMLATTEEGERQLWTHQG